MQFALVPPSGALAWVTNLATRRGHLHQLEIGPPSGHQWNVSHSQNWAKCVFQEMWCCARPGGCASCEGSFREAGGTIRGSTVGRPPASLIANVNQLSEKKAGRYKFPFRVKTISIFWKISSITIQKEGLQRQVRMYYISLYQICTLAIPFDTGAVKTTPSPFLFHMYLSELNSQPSRIG